MITTIAPLLHPRQTAAASASIASCTWPGHCLGAACSSNNDCDNDWICVQNVCNVCCETGDPTSLDTQTATEVATTATNGLTTSPTATTASTTVPAASASATAKNTSHKPLGTGAAIGVGIGIVVVVALIVGIAIWVWRKRRERRTGIRTPAIDTSRSPSGAPSTLADDRKRLVATSREELHGNAKPAELSAFELVELEGDSGTRSPYSDEVRKEPIMPPEPRAPYERTPRYKFEEYEISPQVPTHGPASFSPVSEDPYNNTIPTFRRKSGDEQEATLVAREGTESTHTLFRFPETAYSSISNSPRH